MFRISRLAIILTLSLALLALMHYAGMFSGAALSAGTAAGQTATGDSSRGATGAAGEASFRILLGLTDAESKSWDGSISVKDGKLERLEPWRFDDGDSLQNSSWKIATHRARAFGAQRQQPQQPQAATTQQTAQQPAPQAPQPVPPPQQPAPQAPQSAPQAPQAAPQTARQPAQAAQQPGQPPPQPAQPFVANGIIATFKNLKPNSEVRVKTAQGDFQFRAADIQYGQITKFLDGRAMVDRIPVTMQLTRSRDDQDYPAAAVDAAGNIWIAFMQFSINPKFAGIRMALGEAPKNFSELAEPAGGDQIFLMRYSKGSWSNPIPVSEARGDLYRPAVGIDGSGRVWVCWTANSGANFDLYARPFQGEKGGSTVRLTTDAGPDILPVAATDSAGRVWIAWQAFRHGHFQIHAARQEGDAFSAAIPVAASAANEWNPAIAASPSGQVTVAWDSYRSGNYDVYFRSFDSAGKPGAEQPAANTSRYEAYPTVAYDPSGRLWLAWEESDEAWGKDFGAYETTGIGLYQGRWIRLKVWQGGKAFIPGNLDAVLPGVPDRKVDSNARQSDAHKDPQPDPSLAKNRPTSRIPVIPPRPLNSYPRLLSDRSGRIWLAYRTAHPIWWTALGTVWFENVVSFDGNSWSNPIFLNHSDNLLDNRPALAAGAPGEVMIIRSSDSRQKFDASLRRSDIPAQQFGMRQDPYNNDLYASTIVLGTSVSQARLEAAPGEDPGTNMPAGRSNVRALREYRARVDGVEYRIVRGEFHRHTEISMDAGRDGSIWDAWRYALDAAALDWIGCCDHDNGFGREYSWWTTQKLTDIFLLTGVFTPMFNYERSVAYPEGHRNVIFAQRGVRTLPRLPKVKDDTIAGGAPDTRMLYDYLRHFNGIVASHTSATNMGTDWRDNDPLLEPLVEIYQGDRQNYEMPDAPRSNNEKDSIGGWRPKGFVSLALLDRGYRLGFQASSDHISTHMSYCNLFTTAPTREALLEAFKKRHVYGATDDILADVRSGNHLMGEQFETSDKPSLTVKLMGTAPFAKVHVVKDNRYVYSHEPKTARVEFTWMDTAAQAGKTSYYYVRGEQQDGEIVWVSPMWITYRGK
ncbi:MAG TPA: hypothetical protein VGK99_04180 [Acidobacteriota bacterium]|jgi:hypothetical protein